MKINPVTAGRQLELLRKSLGLTQAEAARIIGCAPNTVTRWECGTMRMRFPEAILARLAATTQSAP